MAVPHTLYSLGAARVVILGAPQNVPSGDPREVLGKSAMLCRLSDGWNTFQFVRDAVIVSVGRAYAIVLDPLSACDWRVQSRRKRYDRGTLFERWGAEGWEVASPACDATFRTYVEPIPDGVTF